MGGLARSALEMIIPMKENMYSCLCVCVCVFNSLLTWLTSVYTGFLVSPLQIVTFGISVVFDLITEAHYKKYIVHNT